MRHRAQAAVHGRSLKLGQLVPVVWASRSGHRSFRLECSCPHLCSHKLVSSEANARGRGPCFIPALQLGHPRRRRAISARRPSAARASVRSAARPHADAERQVWAYGFDCMRGKDRHGRIPANSHLLVSVSIRLACLTDLKAGTPSPFLPPAHKFGLRGAHLVCAFRSPGKLNRRCVGGEI